MINFKQTYNRAEFLKFLDQFLPEDSLSEVEDPPLARRVS